MRDDVTRPVHLKIFADLARRPGTALRDFTVFELYDIATDETFDREMEKPERLGISATSRNKIIESVAWWLWQKEAGRSLNFNVSEIPIAILNEHLPSDRYEQQALIREIFSGAFIERKFGENFFFAHRSFLEFFVAKRLLNSRGNSLSVNEIDAAINHEIMQFMQASGRIDECMSYVFEIMQRFSGELKLLLLREVKHYIARNPSQIANPNFRPNVKLLISALPLYDTPTTLSATVATTLSSTVAIVEKIIRDDLILGGDRAKDSFFYLTDALLLYLDSPELTESLKSIVRFMASSVDPKLINSKRAKTFATHARTNNDNIFQYLFIRSMKIEMERNIDRKGLESEPILAVDFGRILLDHSEVAKPKIIVSNRTAVHPGRHIFRAPIGEYSFPPELNRFFRAQLIDANYRAL